MAIPDQVPPAFSANPQENIIAFSLFGANSLYCETSILNIQLAKQIYPEWTCRFYVDDTVASTGATAFKRRARKLFRLQILKTAIWFVLALLVMDDPTIMRFLIRDADSIVSHREKQLSMLGSRVINGFT